VTDPSQVSSEEISHTSLVTAIETIISWEDYYTSQANTFSDILSQLTSEFTSYRTLLTAASYISSAASPSFASASHAIASIKTRVTDITSVLSAITYAISNEPSLSCAESIIGSYAHVSPTVVTELFSAIESPSTVASSEVTYYATLVGEYPSLVSALDSVVSAEVSYPSLSYYEESFIYAASIYSDIIYYFSYSYTVISSDEGCFWSGPTDFYGF
jgi:hypothetical protein